MSTIAEPIRNRSGLPPFIEARLWNYLERLDQALPGQIGGLYLHGSAGQGGFNEHFSDLDLIVVCNTPLDEPGIDRLEKLHKELQVEHPPLKLEVHFLQWADLGRDQHEIPPHPYYKTPLLSRAERHHLNPFIWWILKHHSLALRGPQPADLPFEVGWQALWEWNKKTLRRYWSGWTRSPRNLLSLWDNEVACWSVLGVCRLYYNLRERDVITKEGAGEYVLGFAPGRYERVLREALRIRAAEGSSYYPNRLLRAVDVVRFINYMVRTCQQIVIGEPA